MWCSQNANSSCGWFHNVCYLCGICLTADHKEGSRDGFSSYSYLNLCFLIINWRLLCSDATSLNYGAFQQSLTKQCADCSLWAAWPLPSSVRSITEPPEMLWTTWISCFGISILFWLPNNWGWGVSAGEGGGGGAAGAHGQAVLFVLMGGGSHVTRPFTPTAAEAWLWGGPGDIAGPVLHWSPTIWIRAQKSCSLLKWALTEWIPLPQSEPVGPTWMLGYSNLSPRLSSTFSHWPSGMVTWLLLF